MMKINVKKIALIVLCATIITSCIASSTVAYYKSSVGSATDSATVAKWGLNNAGTVNVNLFKKAYSYASSATAEIIAPGTSGSSSITISAIEAPEVNYKLIITIEKTSNFDTALVNKLKFSWNDQSYVAINALQEYEIYCEAGQLPDVSDITLYWKWEQGDDTSVDSDVAACGKTAEVNVTVTAEQIFTAPQTNGPVVGGSD